MSATHEHPAAWDEPRLLAECDVRRTRASGPGGQHRNKVETAVTVTHRPTGLAAQASERRSQHENRTRALWRLRVRLAIEHRRPIGLSFGSSDLWRSRCVGGRIVCNPSHADFPALLAEAMDVLAERAMDPRATADALGCTPTQLVKFLAAEPAALAKVNAARQSAGLHALR
ncbi:MAG: Peptide chain release factor 1 [Phycisphaerae bacterium]|nr:Peptide chain release factor 1 [Phycisphaerae bacterium]